MTRPSSNGGERESGFVDIAAGVWVHYDVRGPSHDGAPCLVLLPPLGGSGDLFAPFREDLARDHRVVTCEPPGSGDGSSPTGFPSTRALALDVIGLLDGLGIARAHLFGISLGGMVAQWVAIEAPARVDRLVLASTAARGLSPLESLTAETLGLARCLVMAREPGVALVREIVSDDLLAAPGEAARLDAAVRAHPHDRADLVWLTAAAAAHDARDRLPSVASPALVITGRDDALIVDALQRELASLLARDGVGAEHAYVEGAGHDVTLEKPAETAALVRAFLRGDRA